MKTIAYHAVLLVLAFIVLTDCDAKVLQQRQVKGGDEINLAAAASIMRKVSATEARLAETEVWDRLLSSSSMSASSHANAPLSEAAPALAATDSGLLAATPSAIITPPLRRRLASSTEARLAETEVWDRLLSSSSMSVSASSISSASVAKAPSELDAVMINNLNITWPEIPSFYPQN